MFQTTTRRILAGTGVALLVATGLAACGDDDDSATTAEFCAQVIAADDGDDAGPFEEYFRMHPDPTLEDAAADLDIVTENIQEMIDQVEGFDTSDEAEPLVKAVLAQMETMKENVADSQQAASDGDQAEFDRLEAVNQDTNVPALMTAFSAVEELCAATES